MFSLLLCGMTQALSIDVTTPGDVVQGIPNDGDWPAGEAPPLVIDDNAYTKYLNFRGLTEITGFQVSTSLGEMIVTGMSFTTGNDGPGRDPVAFELYGSNDSIDGPYMLIASGDIVDFSQEADWPRNAKNETPITFANVTAYVHYQVLFTALRVPDNGCCMQISEVELLADVTPVSGWAYRDIDTSGGEAWEDGGEITIRASGVDIWGGSDSFGYLYRPLLDGGVLDLNLTKAGNTNPNGWSKVGPMIRTTLEGGSQHGLTAMTGTNGIQFVWRLAPGGASDGLTRNIYTLPRMLRIERNGDKVISKYFGLWDPTMPPTWIKIGEQTIVMGADVYIGVAVCAGNAAAMNYAVLDNVVLTAPPVEFPWDMKPEDGAERVSLTPTLSWMAGDSATSHDVYIGTDPAALALADTVTDPEYPIDTPLLASTKYYWQIVEQPGDVAGPVISFTTLYEAPWYTGTLNWEQWHDMWWEEVQEMVDSIIYMEWPPNLVAEMPDAYYGPDSPVENYGVRLSGHLVPGTSGDYTFWIAADDGCRLRLNTNNDVADMVTIAGFYRYSGYFDHWPSQMSEPISLVGGQKYTIEILLKEAGGGDWVEVAWEGPDAPSRPRITGDYLTAAYALNPKPNIRQTITPLKVGPLSWTAGKYATSQEVLFGTDPGAMVSIATLPADPTVIVERSTLAMPAVAAGNTYYWQVNGTDGTDTWVGDVWSFTVSDWTSKDIGVRQLAEGGVIPPAGSSTYDEGTGVTVVRAGGNELWGDRDQFHYRYTTVQMTRDMGTITARVLSIQNPDSWRRGGVMIRENLGISSRKVMMHKTGHDNTRMQWRDNWRAGTGNGGDWNGLGFPTWVRLTRDHDRFDGYLSMDGVNWEHRGTAYIAMAPGQPVYIGLAQCHHNSQDQSTLTTGTFDNFSYTTPDIKQSWNLNPPNGATMVDIHATLTWGAGEGVTEHRVYFSADEEAVVNRTVAPVILPAETTELAVGPLDLGQVYYWCVDEVSNPVTPGEVMSFTAEEYRTIEDFESYDVGPEALPPQVMTPGEILVEAVPPPAQAWVLPQSILMGSDDGPQIVTDPDRGLVLALDGDGDYVDCGNPAALNFSTGDWTLSAWVKNTMTGTGDTNKGSIIANGGDGGGGHRYCLVITESDEGRVTLVTDDNSKKRTAKGGTNVNDDVWHHVLGVRDGGKVRLYIDGVEDASSDINEDLSGASQANVLIGAITLASDGSIYKTYAGLIDDVRIYDSALSTDNVAFLADKGGTAPATGPIANWAFEGDFTDSSGNGFDGTPVGEYELIEEKIGYYGPLIAHYTFDEGSGDTAVDSSGNGLNGVISGAVYTATTADGSASCLDFNGFGDNVLNGLAGPYLNLLDELSISLWVQSDEIASDKGFFMGHDPGSDRYGMRYDSLGGSADPDGNDVIKYGVAATGGNEEDESSQFVQTTEWQHIVMTWKSGVGLTLWINGIKNTPTFDAGAKGGLTAGYDKILVGKGSKDGAADAGWDGRIDDVRVYGRTLSEGEVRWLAGLGNIALPDRYAPMISHHQFENDYTDSSGNNFDGTPLGGATIVDDPIQGLVANFVGVDGSVNIGDSDLFNFAGSNFAISAWVNLNSWGGGWGNVIVGKRGEGGVGWQLRRFGNNDRFSFTTRGMGEDDNPQSNLSPNMNQWYNVTAMREGGQKLLYIDGVLDSTAAVSGQVTPCAHNVYIGARANGDNSGPESFFDGMVDEVRIYRSALNLGQIRALAGYVPTNNIGDTWSGRASATPALEYLTPAHEGSQSMRVDYTGSGAVTRLEPFGDGAHPHGDNGDFSLGQAQAMTVWFRGHPENAPGAMFAQLTTVVPSGHTQRVVYDGDPEDLLNPNWQEWNITLLGLSTGKPFDPELPDEGLPITKIKDVGVGIIAAGSGALYFDDLRLYPTRCVPKYGPAYDLTDDCVVDREDMGVIAKAWLAEEGGQGLWYEYYEGSWSVLPYFPSLPLVTQGTADNFGVGQRLQDDNFGLRFTGIVAAPVGGDYTFYTTSDDGSKLYIDGTQVVDNDGLHGGQWREGTINLDAGEHMIEVIMFELGGGELLQVEVAGPGIPRMAIPNEVLFLAPGIPADLNGDGIVNFLDYADVLNHFGDEAMFPPPGEQL